MLSLEVLLRSAIKTLTTVSKTPHLDAELLLSFVLHCSRSELMIRGRESISESEHNKFLELLARRMRGEPIAYLLGQREFWSLPLIVTPDVLIPRPETELLVELVFGKFFTPSQGGEGSSRGFLQQEGFSKNVRIADLGTGSGAIALAIAHERPKWHIVATDKSAKAIEIAKLNAQRLSISNIEFRLGDWTQALRDELFDLIVSNPPYIAEHDPHLKEGDLYFEPQTALIAGSDGLRDLRIIIEQANKYLKPEGWLIVEHGYDQGKAVQELLIKHGYQNVQDYQDLAGNSRATEGQFNFLSHPQYSPD